MAAAPKLWTAFPAYVASANEPTYLFFGVEAESALKSSYYAYDKDGNLVLRFEQHLTCCGLSTDWTVRDGAGKVVARMDKSCMSLAKYSITDPAGNEVARTATVPGMAKFAVQVFLPQAGSRRALMVAPATDGRSAAVWQCEPLGKSIGRDDGVDYCVAPYGGNVAMGFVSALFRDTTYHMEVSPGGDALLAACALVAFDGLMQWDSAQWVL